ncbi:unnamed protein product [Effrenium voratum]|uniref:Pentatricopeptide repeat-containing protein, chloroplastic n=1 Tax=Effrenium voratum TaxID=2562239 RepID=A0AA36I2X1_9DINO|nr:unnamed protein product [Effrenium voratum]CAJ1418594.1 unnamed protein product [Effrenium voratum]
MKPDVIQWNKRISRASGSRALQLLEEVQAVQLQPTVVSFTAALRALSGARVWRRALQLWQRMGQQGLEHDVVACNAAASCLEAWSEAAVFLRELQVRCLKVDTISHNAAISTCEASQWQQASALLDVLQVKFLQPTAVSLNAVMSAERRWPASLMLLQMGARCLEATAHSYSAAVSACGKFSWAAAWALLGESAGRSLTNVVVVSAAISAASAPMLWTGASQLLASLPAVTSVAFGAAVSAVASSGRWQKALELWQECRAQSLADIITCNAAVSACEHGAWQTALRLLQEARIERLHLTLVSYNSTITSCEKGSAWKTALALLAESKSSRLEPDVVTYNSALSACEKSQRWQAALLLFAEVSTPDLITYSSAVGSCRRSGQHALALLKSAADQRVQLDPTTYGLALSACELAGASLAARRLLGLLEVGCLTGASWATWVR